MKFLKIHVLTDEDLADLIENEECTSMNDIDCKKVDFSWDYHQIALVSIENSECLIWNDNVHTFVENDISNFLDGIRFTGTEVEIEEIAMLDSDIRNLYRGVIY